jgi:exopolysaccharide biosynthesis polyprenyl glycosylphosphotransferase
MQMRLWLPFGRVVLPEWAGQLYDSPTLWMHIGVMVVWMVSLILASVYTPRKVAYWGEELQRLLLGHVAASLILAGLLYLAKFVLPRLTFAYYFLLVLALFVTTRALMRLWYRMRNEPALETMRLVAAGDGAPVESLAEQMQQIGWPGLQLVGVVNQDGAQGSRTGALPVLGSLDRIEEIIVRSHADGVIVAMPRELHSELASLVARLNRLPVRLYIVPDYFDLAFFDATIERLGTIPVIGLRDPAIDGLQRILKRVMDVGVSATVLLLLAPVLGLAAAAIKIEDAGPVIYRTSRMGENGRVFQMLKLRSMVVGADAMQAQLIVESEDGKVVHKRMDDPRVTRVGRVLRRTSIDELPQLVNVLRGEMSLVGPRPELPWLVDRYASWQHKRFAVPQGMTGWWQINGRSADPLLYEHVDEDLYYIQNYSLWLDIQILWKTLAVVLRGRGAY